jgi:tetratricopeptide (TPR) repeat protein
VDPEVREVLEAARRDVRLWPWAAGRWGRLGILFYIHDFAVPARECLAEAERRDPHEPRWPYFYGLSLLRDRPADSIAYLHRAAERSPVAAPRLRLAEAYLQLDRLEEAEAAFRQVLQQQPGDPRSVLGLAQIAMKRGELGAAQDQLGRLAAHPATAKAAQNLLAEVSLRRGDSAAATQAQQKAAALPEDPPWPDPYLDEARQLLAGADGRVARAAHLMNTGQLAEAAALLQETVNKYPDFHRAAVELAQLYIRAGQWPQAEAELRDLLARAPDLVPARIMLGKVLQHERRPREALAAYQEAVKSNPAAFLAHQSLGECYLELNQPDEALAAFRETLRYKPNLAEVQFQVGRLLARRGEYDAAVEHLRAAVDLSPANTQWRALLDEVTARKGRRTPTEKAP